MGCNSSECGAKCLDVIACLVCTILVICLFAVGVLLILDSQKSTTNSLLGECELIGIETGTTNDTYQYEWKVYDLSPCDNVENGTTTFIVNATKPQDYDEGDKETCLTDDTCSKVQLSVTEQIENNETLQYTLAAVMFVIGCGGIGAIICLLRDPMK